MCESFNIKLYVITIIGRDHQNILKVMAVIIAMLAILKRSLLDFY